VCVISVRNLSLYLFKRRAIKLIGVIIKTYCPIQLHTKFYLACQVQLHIWTKLLVILSVDFLHLRSGIDPILYIYQVLERNGIHWGVIQLFIDLNKACDYISRQVVYSILGKFFVRLKLHRLITISETIVKPT
jgi:hypothetical protein